MRALRLFIVLGMLCGLGHAQVKIGDNPQTIDPAAVLELESTTAALIITRVTTQQMEAILPDQGALVYNIETQCVHYYDGAQWVNLCEGASIDLTADPIINPISTIVLTQTADGNNIEVAPNSIRSEQIIDGGIFGNDINDNSIGANKLARNSVGKIAMSENAVGPFAIDRDSLPLSFFINDVPFLTAGDIPSVVSGDVDNSIILGSDDGAFYNDQPLVDAIATNTTDIANDLDGNPANELQVITLANSNQLSLSQGGGTITLPTADGSDTQITEGTNITVVGNGTLATPYIISADDETDGDITNELQDLNFNATTNILTISNPATANNQVDLSALAATGTGTVFADQSTITGNGATAGTAFQVPTGGITTTQIANTTILAEDLNQMGAANGQVLKWNGTTWAPDNDAGGTAFTAGNGLTLTGTTFDVDDLAGEVTGPTNATVIANDAVTNTNIANATILAEDLNQMGAANGQVLKWNGTTWAPDNDAGGTAFTAGNGLTLTGTTFDVDDLAGEVTGPTNATVIANDAVTNTNIANATILAEDLNQMGAANGQVLKWNGTTWAPDDDEGLAQLTDGTILIGDAANVPQEQLVSGDATLDNSGVLTLTDDSVNAINLNPDVVGTGIIQNAAGALEIDPTAITGDSDITSTDLVVGGPANALLEDITLELAPGEVNAANLNADVAGNGLLQNASGALEIDPTAITGDSDITSTDLVVGGPANALLEDITLELAPGEVNAANLNADVAGAGLQQNASGALEIDPTAITGDSDITSTDLVVGGPANALLEDITLELAPGEVNAVNLNSDIAGNGLLQNAAGALEVDPTTITGDGDITSSNLTVTGGANAAFNNVTIDIPAGAIAGGAGGLIADNTITASDLDADSVDSSELRADSVGESELRDGEITPSKFDLSGTSEGDILIIDGGVAIWRAPASVLKSPVSNPKTTSIRRVSKNKVTLTANDHTLILEETVTQLVLPSANASLGIIYVIKDLGGATTNLNVSYRDFDNKLHSTTQNGGAIWIQSDGTEWQLIK